jgi:putative ATPase
MKELGYGRGYRYAHDSPDAYLHQEYLPDTLRGAAFYVPGPFERRVAERMEWWARKRAEAEEGKTGTSGADAGLDAGDSGDPAPGGDR